MKRKLIHSRNIRPLDLKSTNSIHAIDFTQTSLAALSTRGGAAANKEASAQKQSTSSNKINDKFESNLPQVIAILRPRPYATSWTRILSSLTMGWAAASILLCYSTVGQPYSAAIWETLYGGEQSSANKLSSEQQKRPPHHYQPTAVDRLLLQSIPSLTLPSRILPSPNALISLFSSLFAYVLLVVLLPRWATAVHVFYNYQTLSPSQYSANKMSQLLLADLDKANRTDQNNKNKWSVLVQLAHDFETSMPTANPTGQQSGVSSKKNTPRVICPLFIQHNPHNNSTLLYFDLEGRRYFYDPSSRTTTDGGPRLHLEPLKDLVQRTTMADTNDNHPSIDRSLMRQRERPRNECLLTNTEALHSAQNQFLPYNQIKLSSPSIFQVWQTRLFSPLVILQLFGELFSLLLNSGQDDDDNYDNAALIRFGLSVGGTLSQHYWSARQSVVSTRELYQEVQRQQNELEQLQVHAYRPQSSKSNSKKKQRRQQRRKKGTAKLQTLSAMEILPGDVFYMFQDNVSVATDDNQDATKTNNTASSMSRSKLITMPIDALLLEGNCVVNEAVLTGETVSQSKIPIQVPTDDSKEDNICLDMKGLHRSSVLFAGTSVILMPSTTEAATTTTASDQSQHEKLFAKQARRIKCLALRTGTYSSRGDLLRALQRNSAASSSMRRGKVMNQQFERDGLVLIGSLSLFAFLSCTWFWLSSSAVPFLKDNKQQAHRGVVRHTTSTFRRVLHCFHIAVASIPSALPSALTSIVETCALRLKRESHVVTADPGALLTAASVDIVIFDKTGTLTADTQSLANVVFPPDQDSKKKKRSKGSDRQWLVLAGSHSLVHVEKQIVGDPLDRACLKYAEWTHHDFQLGAFVAPNKKKRFVKLWQICSFPFDPARKTSSAVLLVQTKAGKFELWEVIKGSPSTMANLITIKGTSLSAKKTWYQKEIRRLGRQGTRTVTLGARKLAVSETTQKIFPHGLPTNEKDVEERIEHARTIAQKVVMREQLESGLFDFAGIACFDASIRPSTNRIIHEIQSSNKGIRVQMLTGDGLEAAIFVAKRSGLVSDAKQVAILDTNDEGPKSLVWRNEEMEPIDFEFEVHGNVMEKYKDGLAISGSAVEYLLLRAENLDVNEEIILAKLHEFSVIAQCSPKNKMSFVSALRRLSKKKVLMCGDGVNDVSAMKSADCAASLLNGYGDEGQQDTDTEDQRRRQTIRERRKIGSNRLVATATRKTSSQSWDIRKQNRERISREMKEALMAIKAGAAQRQGLSSPNDPNFRFSFQDLRESFGVIFRISSEERKRAQALQKGGAGAARVLLEEDKLRDTGKEMKKDSNKSEPVIEDIKPGEASMVSSFSCLRPAIDGVEALMRAGVAAAASSISTMQGIGLQCLMNCYNLATLYKDGLSYGRYMWKVESALYVLMGQASHQTSCTPRPRLPPTKVPESLFDSANTLSTCAQAFIHLVTLSSGVRICKFFEDSDPSALKPKPRIIRQRTLASRISGKSSMGNQKMLAERLVEALLKAPVAGQEEDGVATVETRKNKNLWQSLFARPPFKPNFVANFVFLMSIFQAAVSKMVNHRGEPFCASLLESRPMVLSIVCSLLFPILMLTNALPWATKLLELRPMSSKLYKIVLLGVFMVDILGCWIANKLASHLRNISHHPSEEPDKGKQQLNAADEEEQLFQEETLENTKILTILLVGGLGLAFLNGFVL